MLRAWRNECLGILAAGLALLIVGLATGSAPLLLAIGLVAYLGWHAFNFVLLHRWISRSQKLHPPVSLGVWEAILDGLQRRQLRHRRRRSGLVRQLLETRNASEQLPDALVLLAEDHGVLWFNAAAGRLLALAWPRDRGRKVTELIRHPALQDALTGAGSGRSLAIASPANGAWVLSIQITGSFGIGRRLLVARDVTLFHDVEQVRRDFVANVSHELRTPITVFRGYLGTLRKDATNPAWTTPLGSMEAQARRMQDLVDDLLVLSRLEMTRNAPSADLVDVPAMLEGILEQARALSGENRREITLEANSELILRGDEAELHSAFSNLIFNAVRYTPPDARIAVTWEGNADHACMAVRDTGPGIAAQHLPRLTERFYRVDRSRSRRDGGAGLGLAIVNQVLLRHNAELRITSVPGEGSVFSCHFPGVLVEIQERTRPIETVG